MYRFSSLVIINYHSMHSWVLWSKSLSPTIDWPKLVIFQIIYEWLKTPNMPMVNNVITWRRYRTPSRASTGWADQEPTDYLKCVINLKKRPRGPCDTSEITLRPLVVNTSYKILMGRLKDKIENIKSNDKFKEPQNGFTPHSRWQPTATTVVHKWKLSTQKTTIRYSSRFR